MKKIAVTFLLIIFFFNISKSQLSNIQGLDNIVIRTKKYEDISGSAYLYATWNPGTLIDRNGKIYSNLLLKYDTYRDQIELNLDGQVMEVNPLSYQKFSLNSVESIGNNVIKHSFSSGYNVIGFAKTSYFDILFEGELILLKKYKTSFIEDNVTGYSTSGPMKSFQSKVLYFLIKDSISMDIKPNKKSVLEVFTNHSSDIETFLRERKIKVRSESDLIEIIKFLDSF